MLDQFVKLHGCTRHHGAWLLRMWGTTVFERRDGELGKIDGRRRRKSYLVGFLDDAPACVRSPRSHPPRTPWPSWRCSSRRSSAVASRIGEPRTLTIQADLEHQQELQTD